jgi:hypothetical protein
MPAHDPCTLFFLLLFGHALADQPLQTLLMSQAKRGSADCPAWLGLSYHAIIHGGFVLLFSGSFGLGVAEFIAHYIIDAMKCRELFGCKVDQALHLLCKVVWVMIWMLIS